MHRGPEVLKGIGLYLCSEFQVENMDCCRVGKLEGKSATE